MIKILHVTLKYNLTSLNNLDSVKLIISNKIIQIMMKFKIETSKLIAFSSYISD